MDIKDLEALIQKNKVSKSKKAYDFDSFNALCAHIGVPVKKGGSERKLYEKHFKRFFDWEKVPGTNKIKITSTYYGKPIPYVSHRTGIHWTELNTPIAYLLIMHPELLGKPMSKYAILKAINLMRKKPKGLKDRKTDTYFWYYTKMYDTLSSSFTQAKKTGMLHIDKKYSGYKARCKVPASKMEYDLYEDILSEVCRKYGLKNIMGAKYVGKYSRVISETDSRAESDIGMHNVHEEYVLSSVKTYTMDNCMEDYAKKNPKYYSIWNNPKYDIAAKQKLMIKMLEDDFWTEVANRIVKEGGFGIVSAETYRKQLKQIRG